MEWGVIQRPFDRRLLSLALLVMAGCNQVPSGTSPACALAEGLIEYELKHADMPNVFGVGDQEAGSLIDAITALRTPPDRDNWYLYSRGPDQPSRQGPGVSRWLSLKFAWAGGPSSITECSNVRRRLNQLHVPFGKAAVERAANRIDQYGRYLREIDGVSLPIMSGDGNDALVAVSYVRAPLGGGGHVIHLRRLKNARWMIVQKRQTWIS